MPVQAVDDRFFESEIVDFFKQFLPRHKSEMESSIDARHFTRERRFTLPVMLALLINMVRPGKRMGYQGVISPFFNDTRAATGELPSDKPPDKAAFQRARKKLPLDIIQSLYSKAVAMATDLAARFDSLKWRGFRVLAIDGTRKNMPWSAQLEEFFGVPQGASRPQMLNCTLYDVLAKLPIDGVAAPFASSERALAGTLFHQLRPGDLLLMDREYPGFRLFDDLIGLGIDFLIRLPHNGLFSSVQAFLKSGGKDGTVKITASKTVVREYQHENLPAPQPITVRILKVRLPNGTDALFATTLLDCARYSANDLADLYRLRWEEEEFFKLIKGLLEAENFRGKSPLFIAQELLAINLYCLLTRILMLQSALKHGIAPENLAQKPAFLAAARFLDRIWQSRTWEQCLQWVHLCIVEISWSRYRKRPNRSYPRNFRR